MLHGGGGGGEADSPGGTPSAAALSGGGAAVNMSDTDRDIVRLVGQHLQNLGLQ